MISRDSGHFCLDPTPGTQSLQSILSLSLSSSLCRFSLSPHSLYPPLSFDILYPSVPPLSIPLSISLYSPYSLHSIPPLNILLCLFSPSLFPFSPSLLFCPPSLCSRYCYKDTVPLDPTSWFFYQTNISDPLTRSPGRRKVQFFCEHCAVR